MMVRFRELTWKQICLLKNRPELLNNKVDMRQFVWGFCAFVNSNWVDKNRTYKYAFEYFDKKYLDGEVDIATLKEEL